jgi:translation initiation factor IF-3
MLRHPRFCFWRYAIARPLRVNDQIRIRTVRVIDDEGTQLGVMPTEEALNMARTKGLDLIEVSPTAVPPVCRIGDYGRLKYEQSKKDKDARKKQKNWELREVKLRPKIDVHDYEVKAKMAERLLLDGGKVKVTIMFRGREVTHPERGTAILDRLAEELAELGVVEQRPIQEGRNMTMMMAPSKAVLAGKADEAEASDEVFADGEGGDVASTALQSPLSSDGATQDVETTDARAGDGDDAPAADTPAGDAAPAGDDAAAGDDAPAPARGSRASSSADETADAPADTAVS